MLECSLIVYCVQLQYELFVDLYIYCHLTYEAYYTDLWHCLVTLSIILYKLSVANKQNIIKGIF